MTRVGRPVGTSLLVLALVACAKLNPAYGVAEDGETQATSTTGSDPSTGWTNDPAATVDPDPDPSVASTDDSTTSSTGARGTTDDGASTALDSDVPVAETDAEDPTWSEDCRAEIPSEFCPNSIEPSDGYACQLGPFANSPGATCGLAFMASTSVMLPVGIYVLGSTPPLDAQLVVEGLPGGATSCQPRFFGVVVDAPVTVEVSVFSDSEGLGDFIIRDAVSLCPAPVDCCTSSELNAVAACQHPGLRACVVEADSYCEGTWDPFCIETAVLACGADCEQALP